MSNKEYKPYKADFLSKWPTSLKVFILKAWTAGMVYYFINMSLGAFNILPNHYDRLFVSALILVLLNEYFINLLIKYMEMKTVNMRKHAMFIDFKFSLVVNFFYIIFVVVITIFVGGIFVGLGLTFTKLFDPSEPPGWEPFTFGLYYYFFDTLFIMIKNLAKKIIRKKEKIKHEIQWFIYSNKKC